MDNAPSDYSRYVMGDRDPAALAAKAARSRQDRAKASRAAGRGTPNDDQDKRLIPVTIKLSQREAAELDRQAGDDTRSAFTRDALLDALGIEDTARRTARRRRNPTERKPGKRQR